MSLSLYSKILGLAFVVILAAIWGLASWLQPVDGDLARVGGYAENEFGWRAHKPSSTKTSSRSPRT